MMEEEDEMVFLVKMGRNELLDVSWPLTYWSLDLTVLQKIIIEVFRVSMSNVISSLVCCRWDLYIK